MFFISIWKQRHDSKSGFPLVTLDSGFYSYVEEEECSGGRELNVSSLRRKLFSQDDSGSPTKPAVIEQSSKEKTTRYLDIIQRILMMLKGIDLMQDFRLLVSDRF